jgi:hypothetical protein
LRNRGGFRNVHHPGIAGAGTEERHNRLHQRHEQREDQGEMSEFNDH